jgi:hypothetical protein
MTLEGESFECTFDSRSSPKPPPTGGAFNLAELVVAILVAAIAGWLAEYLRGNSSVRERLEAKAEAVVTDSSTGWRPQGQASSGHEDSPGRPRRSATSATRTTNKVTNEIAGLRVWIASTRPARTTWRSSRPMQSLNNRITELAASRSATTTATRRAGGELVMPIPLHDPAHVERCKRLRWAYLTAALTYAQTAPTGGWAKGYYLRDGGIDFETGTPATGDNDLVMGLLRDLVRKGLLDERMAPDRPLRSGERLSLGHLEFRATDKGARLLGEQEPVDPDVYDTRVIVHP